MLDNCKVDIMNIGIEKLKSETFNKQLKVEIINDWYSKTAIKKSNEDVLPSSFTASISS